MNVRSSLVFVALGAISSVATAAEKLDVKLGLWEMTSSTETKGMPPLPKELLDKLSPEQRKKMESDLRAEQAKGPEKATDRECITQRDLDRPFEPDNAKDCKHTIVSSTRTSQEVHIVCTGATPGSGSLKVAAPTPERMTGAMNLKLGEGAQTMTIRAQLQGRWLSSDCGEEAEDDDQENSADAESSAE
jgi:Protein of unknown function (DUF3617)